MLGDTTIDNNWWYTECQATYNIRSIDSSNAIIQFTRICASLVGGNSSHVHGHTNDTIVRVGEIRLIDNLKIIYFMVTTNHSWLANTTGITLFS